MHHVFQNIFLAPADSITTKKGLIGALSLDHFISSSYVPFHDDFGPMNLGAVHAFCEILTLEIQKNQDQRILIHASSDRRSFTNAVFLLGASTGTSTRSWTAR